jgi:hypothetical protein
MMYFLVSFPHIFLICAKLWGKLRGKDWESTTSFHTGALGNFGNPHNCAEARNYTEDIHHFFPSQYSLKTLSVLMAAHKNKRLSTFTQHKKCTIRKNSKGKYTQ